MSVSCTICKNHMTSQSFVRFYEDSYEEIYKNNLLKEKTDFSYVHLICASFFPETELIILNIATNPYLLNADGNNVVTETIVCNYKGIKAQGQDKCMVCLTCTDSEVLIPCLAKECSQRFHLHCIMNRTDVKKIKLVKSDDTTFKYGVICSDHSQGLTPGQNILLETNLYNFFKILDDPELNEELQGYEDMFTKINCIIDNDPQLHKLFELAALQNSLSNKESAVKKKQKDKRSRQRSKNNDSNKEQVKPTDSKPTPKPENSDKPKPKEKNGLQSQALSAKSRIERNTALIKKFKTRVRKEENKGNEEKKKETESSEKTKKLNRKKSIDPHHLSQGALQPLRTNFEIEAGNSSQEISKEPSEVSETVISLRKKKAGDGSYNLREEIKTTSKLKYDSWMHDFATPKKPKEKTKTVSDSNRLLTTDEKKKAFWSEINEIYFRKPYTDEAELLLLTESSEIAAALESIRNNTDETSTNENINSFLPNFEVNELSRNFNDFLFIFKGVFTVPPMIPNTFNPVDSLKVLFEFYSNPDTPNRRTSSFLTYFRMKKKAQNEMPVPDNPESLDTSSDPKYKIVPSFNNQDLKDMFQDALKPLMFKSKHKFNDQKIDHQDLSIEGYHKLFGLKHIEPLFPEDAINIKAKTMLSKELKEMETEHDTNNLDDLTQEILYFKYLLHNFLVPENNTLREKLAYKMKEDQALPKTIKLQEKARKLESECKLAVIKKFFYVGFQDKSNNIVHKCYFRNTQDQIISELTFIPKSDGEENKDSKTIRLSREVKEYQVIETDCCICFSNQFTEYNPIIYCSNCNASFHKYCYGISELPNEDFYCDICLATNDPASRKAKGSTNSKIRKGSVKITKLPNHDKEIKCNVCNIDEFPLKKFKKTEWFHITCLLLHDMLQLKNSEWILKPEKSSVLEQAKIENPHLECNICKTKSGIMVKCIDKECNKTFHALCAYLQGYEVDLVESEESKDDKTKNGLSPLIYCPEHTKNPNRNLVQQQYFRRYTTNFKNTLNYDTLDDYIKHLNEEEDASQVTTQVEECSNSCKTPKMNEITNVIMDLNDPRTLKRDPDVPTEDLENKFIGGPAKKTKVV